MLRKLHALKVVHRCIHKVGPAYLHHKFQYISDLRDRQTRGSSSGKFHLSSPKTEYYKQLFEYSTVKLWNILLPSIRMLNAPVPFVKACKYWVKWRIILYFLFVLYCLSCLRCTYILFIFIYCFFCCNYCMVTALL